MTPPQASQMGRKSGRADRGELSMCAVPSTGMTRQGAGQYQFVGLQTQPQAGGLYADGVSTIPRAAG